MTHTNRGRQFALRRRRRFGWTALAFAMSLGAREASAQVGQQSVTLAGYGEVSYGQTNRNTFLNGTPDGNYVNSRLGLLLSAPLSDRVSISALGRMVQDTNGTHGDLSYAFATLRLTRSLDLRFGKVKHPGSLYGEVLDVGTLRPFLNLPQAIYGGTGNSLENYTGVGLNGTIFFGQWASGISAYAGGGAYEYESMRLRYIPGITGDHWRLPVRKLTGGRVSIRPPVSGLSFGVSGHRARVNLCTAGMPANACTGEVWEHQWGAQAEYLTDRLWLRSEYAWLKAGELATNKGYYVEGAYFLTRQLQAATQFNAMKDDVPETQFSVPMPKDIDRHRELAYGLNYWLAAGVVLKTSIHEVTGNRFAVPNQQALLQGLVTGQLPRHTRLLQAGLQFSF